jgi:uncharacterized protein YjeT (DUF2065 family)
MSDDVEGVEVNVKERQLRRLGAGTVISGLLVVLASRISADPFEPMVGILGFLGIAAIVFEYTENAQRGVSLGFLASGVLVWIYPVIVPPSEASPVFVGLILVFAGLFNIVFTSVIKRLQDLLGGRGGAEGETD